MAGSFEFTGCFIFLLSLYSAEASSCVNLVDEIKTCDMIDYMLYDNLDIGRARAQAEQLIAGHVGALKNVKKASKHKRVGQFKNLTHKFCTQLVRATICNILFPPCEGDGSQRYRKPCVGFERALFVGCGLSLAFGDMTFAYPPDCYELPIVPRVDEEFADSDMIGSWRPSSGGGGSQSTGRGADLVKLGVLLHDGGETEHAAHMFLSALRHTPNDAEAHTRRARARAPHLDPPPLTDYPRESFIAHPIVSEKAPSALPTHPDFPRSTLNLPGLKAPYPSS